MPRQKGNKTKLTLSVDKNLVEAAKNTGINLSAFLELQLRQYLAVLKNGCSGFSAWARPDSNRGPPACEAGVITTRPRALKGCWG